MDDMKHSTATRREGFEGQVLIRLPPELYQQPEGMTGHLYLTDIGYFPRAAEHLVTRTEGCSQWVLVICIQGKGFYDPEGLGRRQLGAWDAFMIPPGRAHRYGSEELSSWELMWVHFSGSCSAEAADTVSGGQEVFSLRPREESLKEFSMLCEILDKPVSPIMYERACGRLWHLLGCLSGDRKHGIASRGSLVVRTLEIMEQSISSSLSLSELSERLGVSPQYLCRSFSHYCGHSPMEHLTQMKIRRACLLLDLTADRISEVSSAVGYEDPYYFSRVFKRVMGLSPRDYRNLQH